MTGGYAFRDEDEKDMTIRRSIGWVAVGVGTLAGVVALAFFLAHGTCARSMTRKGAGGESIRAGHPGAVRIVAEAR